MIEPERKRRRKPRPLRFAEIEVGHILIQRRKTIRAVRPKRPIGHANDDPQELVYVPEVITAYAIVTDLWFDPVYGQNEESTGQMVGCQYWISGAPMGSKWPYNRLGLARAGWNYATAEEIAGEVAEADRLSRLRRAFRDGEIVPIRSFRG
jgi:hypothetical protein